MRTLLLVLLAVAALPPVALADSVAYTMIFTPTAGLAPTSGSFTYDDQAPNFTNFVISWNGWQYNFTSLANSLDNCINCANGIRGNVPCLAGQTGAAAAFALLNGACNLPGWNSRWSAGVAAFPDISHFEIFSTNLDGTGTAQLATLGGFAPGSPLVDGNGAWTIERVPEPASFLMLVLGLPLYGFLRSCTQRSTHGSSSRSRKP